MADGRSWKNKMEHPVIASLATIAVVASGLTGLATITGWYDNSHTTAAELEAVTERVARNTVLATCARLDIKISLVEQSIWQMEQLNEDSQRLVEKRRELRNMTNQYRDLRCSQILK